MRNNIINNYFLVVSALLVVLLSPCISLATSFSDFQPGNVDNSSVMYFNKYFDKTRHHADHFYADHTGPRGPHGPGGPGGPKPPAAPIPSAVWLLGTGLVGLIGIRRRLKN
jgi:hypothetical protein